MRKNFEKTIFSFLIMLFSFSCFIRTERKDMPIDGKHIVVITASRNNAQWYKKNLDSFFNQTYKNSTMIYVDDCSTDGTGDLVEQYIKEKGQEDRVLLIKNKERTFTFHNQYYPIHSCKDDDVIVILDGDDWFAHEDTLAYINKVYSEEDVWITYGQFENYPWGTVGQCYAMDPKIIAKNGFREVKGFPFSHLRTFYAGLFKKIKKEDLMYQGEFIKIIVDVAAMYPMLEMARNGHIKFIPDVLYIHNRDRFAGNQEELKERIKLCLKLHDIVRKRKKYGSINSLY